MKTKRTKLYNNTELKELNILRNVKDIRSQGSEAYDFGR